ncbi:hypothetical protein HDU96_007003 [Phlyctochytrium bullatum]|nr:hypothetical protein HDU96_007003 [Phlyctochytrium bullatum]
MLPPTTFASSGSSFLRRIRSLIAMLPSSSQQKELGHGNSVKELPVGGGGVDDALPSASTTDTTLHFHFASQGKNNNNHQHSSDTDESEDSDSEDGIVLRPTHQHRKPSLLSTGTAEPFFLMDMDDDVPLSTPFSLASPIDFPPLAAPLRRGSACSDDDDDADTRTLCTRPALSIVVHNGQVRKGKGRRLPREILGRIFLFVAHEAGAGASVAAVTLAVNEEAMTDAGTVTTSSAATLWGAGASLPVSGGGGGGREESEDGESDDGEEEVQQMMTAEEARRMTNRDRLACALVCREWAEEALRLVWRAETAAAAAALPLALALPVAAASTPATTAVHRALNPAFIRNPHASFSLEVDHHPHGGLSGGIPRYHTTPKPHMLSTSTTSTLVGSAPTATMPYQRYASHLRSLDVEILFPSPQDAASCVRLARRVHRLCEAVRAGAAGSDGWVLPEEGSAALRRASVVLSWVPCRGAFEEMGGWAEWDDDEDSEVVEEEEPEELTAAATSQPIPIPPRARRRRSTSSTSSLGLDAPCASSPLADEIPPPREAWRQLRRETSNLVAALGGLPRLEALSLAVTFSGVVEEDEDENEDGEVGDEVGEVPAAAVGKVGGVEGWWEAHEGVGVVLEKRAVLGLDGERFVAGVGVRG